MNNIERIVNHFLNKNTPKQYNNYATDGKVLVFVDGKKRRHETIAIKFKDIVIGNSSRLNLITGHQATTRRNISETGIQRVLSEKIQMIPFDIFKQANLDLSKFKLIDKGQSETITKIEKKFEGTGKDTKEVTVKIAQHFTGASLFQVDTELFLFDIDRNEIQHGIINPFLVKLQDKTVKNISEAYESLKPQEVKDAEKKGLKVKRQGEWFFIPVQVETPSGKLHERQRLQAGDNRPNYAEKGFELAGMFFVKGTISHSGREHKDLKLKDWYQAIPNTATTSWTVTGDID